ncbi:M3 family oligoendopeptidase [Alkaliphilus serpentinus]|uniref:M3 family oligoendopeptidase n=1 Tax=Alkaliphilus serpentinus TaxID=1482731 RepID=A0A833ME65_9FIRM|nr:M3 family oligoendopeptidase [Alkaliphilus serpentinus]KAB3530441.1 M3 family oligoendopeptidase [Alkaliphilus serpentinus]
MKWNLDDLYLSFEDPKFNRDMEDFYNKVDETNKWITENLTTPDNPEEKLAGALKRIIGFSELYYKLLVYSFLVMSVDAKNAEAKQALGKVNNKYSDGKTSEVILRKWLDKVNNIDEVLAYSDFLAEHTFYIKDLISKNKYLLEDKEEILIAKLTNTGGKAWSELQKLMTSTLMVDIEMDGEMKSLPLTVVRNMADEADGTLRKKAYEAELRAYEKIEDVSAACLNGIKGETITVAKKRGYSSPLEETLNTYKMKKETLDSMLAAMVESLPEFHRFFRKKAELLGHEDGLPFYDVFAPMGKVDKKFSYEEAKEYVMKNFYSFSKDLGDFAKKAFEKEWVDVEPRAGKSGGAFCYNIPPLKQSRILTNFNGSLSDVTTLAHELGHGYHGECLKNQSLLNSIYPMPLAETASIFAETILVNDALKNSTPEEQFAILEGSITHAGQVIVDIYSRYLFETELFNRREDHVLSVKELKEMIEDSQKKAYGDGLNHDFLHPYMWVNKVHYYYPERHFYNFPYAFGLLFSMGLYAIYMERGQSFADEYVKLLEVTGKMTIEDVAATMKIDVTDIEFWRASLKLVKKDIDKFIRLAEK